jgi:hypothetical protein
LKAISAILPDALRDIVDRAGPAGNDDAGAPARQFERHRFSNTRATAGDNRDLTVEPHVYLHSW